jgi:hypothetical protein
MMEASFRNFLTGLIDYAGLFPPASLDIETALGNYAAYLGGEEGWMLGRCIVPALHLHHAALHPGFRYSVIVSPAVPREELEQLSAFTGRVEMVETRLPDSAGSADNCTNLLLHLKDRLLEAGLQEVQLFVEAANVDPVAEAIAAFNNRRSGGDVISYVGYKLRCGGQDKQAFPAPEQVAEAIGACRDNDIAIKFTAGMHHPLRSCSPDIAFMQHGFINVFGAALLAWGCNLTINDLTECLRDESARRFHFTKEGFSWQEKTISADEIKRLRQSKVISFGSCSFTEPVAGLRLLGFLGTTEA